MKPHEILGVAADADDAAVKLAFKRAAMKHHPDRGGDPEEFQRITKAYEAMCKRKCPICEGKGHIRVREGAFVKRQQCPRCWSK